MSNAPARTHAPAAAPAAAGAGAAVPTVAFVSLGCPKALTDSELILTRLAAEGYRTGRQAAGADLVIVNSCGFIDEAVQESLDAIGDALAENGRVIVTGCLGAKAGEGGGNLVRQVHPKVLAVTGPHATDEVLDAVHRHAPKPQRIGVSNGLGRCLVGLAAGQCQCGGLGAGVRAIALARFGRSPTVA
jgi:ribosomal protein S12 methylthiotransferase